MEGVAPPIALLSSVKRAMERGESVKQGIYLYLQQQEGEFPLFVTQWLAMWQQGQDTKPYLQLCTSLYRRCLLQVLERGLRGEAIHGILVRMEEELIEACHEEMNAKLARLPFLMMIPLLLFQFPAFLALLFGPLLKNFFYSLGGG